MEYVDAGLWTGEDASCGAEGTASVDEHSVVDHSGAVSYCQVVGESGRERHLLDVLGRS